MTFDFTDHIKEADEIRTSVRWNALNEKIKKQAAISDKKLEWRSHVFSGLTYRIFSEYHRIKEAHERNDDELAIVAWHARNLLELMIWTRYCTTDDDKARRFYEDAGRDHYDLLNATKVWGDKNNQSSIWKDQTENSLAELVDAAAEHQVSDLNSKYLRVSDAAQQVGMKDNFDMQNKFFSKFAHPTAGHVVLPFVNENAKRLKTVFFANGCLFFIYGFSFLEQHLCSEK